MVILTIDIGGANTKTLLLIPSKNVKEKIFYFTLWKRKNELKTLIKEIKNKYKPEIVG
ncbi:MAG: H4MPT-linked C1 transfer pathway protein, partial [Candidatus Hydrothermarchaeota archaeon]